MNIHRRSFLKSLVLGCAIAFPVTKILLKEDEESLADLLKKTTGREVILITVTGQSNFTFDGEYPVVDPRVYYLTNI